MNFNILTTVILWMSCIVYSLPAFEANHSDGLMKQATTNEVIEIIPYDPEWPQMFEKEARPIQQALDDMFGRSSFRFNICTWLKCKAQN
jgi:hypothetical protein